jgi:hypothetical protein
MSETAPKTSPEARRRHGSKKGLFQQKPTMPETSPGDVDPKNYTIAARLTSPETLYQNFYTVVAKHLTGCSKINLYRMQIENYGAKIVKTVVPKTICI